MDIKQFHSFWAYLVIFMGAIFVISTLIYSLSKKETSPLIRKIGLFTTITFHIQLLIGLAYYVVKFMDLEPSNIMSNAVLRMMFVEHPIMMIAGTTFMTIANAKLKRSPIVKINVFVFALIGFACVLSRIPYDIWL